MDELSRIFDELLPFLSRYEAWIYIVSGAVAIFQLRWLVQGWHEWRNSVFGLEREIAQKRFAAPLTILVLMSMLVVGEFLIVSFVTPAYPQINRVATPTMDLLATSTPQKNPGETITPSLDKVLPTVSAPSSEGCKPGVIEWAAPKVDEAISATVELKGAVNVPNLGFYKYEYAQSGTDKWITIAAGNTPLVSGTIGFWNTSQLPAGDYLLRLVVADNQNQLFPACVIRVRVTKP
jgi:hypothetical protein